MTMPTLLFSLSESDFTVSQEPIYAENYTTPEFRNSCMLCQDVANLVRLLKSENVFRSKSTELQLPGIPQIGSSSSALRTALRLEDISN